MIVRDEQHIIRRCLQSVLPLIDTYSICDTGSTDNTREIILNFFQSNNVPGMIWNESWIDFATNRTKALRLAAGSSIAADFDLIIDADDVIVPTAGIEGVEEWPPDNREIIDNFRSEGLFWPSLEMLSKNVAWDLPFRDAGSSYWRPQLTKHGAGLRYRGVLHEFLDTDNAPVGRFGDLTYLRLGGGARSKDPTKYLRDAELLGEELERIVSRHGQHPDDDLVPRYTYYLAQSLKDAGRVEEAMHVFFKRSRMLDAQISEEAWWARYQGCCIAEHLANNRPPAHRDSRTTPFVDLDSIRRNYLNCWVMRPTRVEPLVRLAMSYFSTGDKALGHLYEGAALQVPRRHTDRGLVDQAILDVLYKRMPPFDGDDRY
jgi:glycosyltransferase involved in cell wall biosynthesis